MSSDRTKLKKRTVFLILTILTVAFIWGHSAIPGGLSSGESRWFRDHIVQPVFTLLHLGRVSNHFVRKLAHVIEYFMLGLLAELLLSDTKLRRHPIFFCFLIAFLDESIQVFSGRGAKIRDIWIDLSGAAAAIVLCFLIRCLIRCFRRRK